MSTTEELLSILEKQFSGWNRDGVRGIRHYLNIVHRILCTVPADQLMIIDESTGLLPSLNTIANIFSYELPSNVNFVSMVLIEVGDNSFIINLRQQDYGRTTRSSQRPFEEVEVSGVRYLRIPYVRSYPVTENSVAKIVFTEDPGTVNDIYRYQAYRMPNDIVSDTIELSIHPPYDMLYLLPATAKMLEAVQNGNYVEAYASITEEFVPKMHNAFNIGAFGVCQDAEDHGF